jgi:MFS superfamily sulfate permease-like transporter
VWIVGAGLFAAQDLGGGGNTWLAKVIAVVAIAVAILLVAGWVAKSPEAAVSE